MLAFMTSPSARHGFRDYLQTGVKIDANSAIRIDITMELGTVTNTVSVKSDALQVETQSTQNGVVIDGTKDYLCAAERTFLHRPVEVATRRVALFP